MKVSYNRWKTHFLFGLGLSLGTAFCMKWMETDLLTEHGKFTILGLELFYSKEKVETIISSIDGQVKTILQYHLYFDFAFMAGVYPCIAALCMMSRKKLATSLIKKILSASALLQLVSWIADIAENYYLLQWIKKPVIGSEFMWYHVIVVAKWIIALAGASVSILVLLFTKPGKQADA